MNSVMYLAIDWARLVESHWPVSTGVTRKFDS
jgi:hypothetical protein